LCVQNYRGKTVNAGTHVAFAAFLGVIGQGLGQPLEPILAGALAIGALLPDVDTTASGLGKFIKPISRLIENKFGHRTITHSFVGLGLFGLMFAPLLVYNPRAFWYLMIGVLSHILLDTVNVVGVPLLYPSRLQFWFVLNRSYRIPYGSSAEGTLAITFAMSGMLLFPLSQEGFTPAFHRFLGTPSGVVSDYLEWRDTNEVIAQVEGFNTETQEKINGQFRVIDALGKEGIVIESLDGNALAAGFVRGASVTTYHIHATRGAAIQVKEYRVELNGRTVGDLINSLPNARRLWVTANLHLQATVSVEPPKIGFYQRVKTFGKSLEVRSARRAELEPYATAYIQSGSAVIRAEYVEGETVRDNLSITGALKSKTLVLDIPNLPSMSGLVIKPGDEISEGQPIARYVNDAALEAKKADSERALMVIKTSTAELERIKMDYEKNRVMIEQNVKEAREKVKRFEFLVNAGAEPRITLVDAQIQLRNAEQARTLALSALTSKKATLEQQADSAKLTIKATRGNLENALNAQWVKAPMNATVQEIRVKAITTKGFTLEVLLRVENVIEKTTN
jgi:membrane-bound metal-dependent hydrolase YbcI (DUF457 family)/biotin carboxyl carrier protein